jgi:mono/diheme cytochrome c family protein
MKSAIAVLAILILLGIVVKMQLGGGMGGMMHEGLGRNTPASQTATTGAEVFMANCANCHRNGGNNITPNLPLKGSRKLADVKTFVQFIRQPKMPDGSAGAMPAFSESTISDQQAKNLYQHASSL